MDGLKKKEEIYNKITKDEENQNKTEKVHCEKNGRMVCSWQCYNGGGRRGDIILMISCLARPLRDESPRLHAFLSCGLFFFLFLSFF